MINFLHTIGSKVTEYTIIFICSCLTALGFYVFSKKIKYRRGNMSISINE